MLKKSVGILICFLASAGLTAGSVQATPLFQAAEYPASLTGTTNGIHAYTASGGATWSCGGKSSMTGSLSVASSTLSLVPSYTECTILGTPMTVNTNGCYYLLHLQSGEKDSFTGTLDIVCPEGKSIEYAGFGCVWRFGAQQGVTGFNATLQTTATPKDVALAIDAKQLSHSEEGTSFACPKNGTFNNGRYQANVTLRADNKAGMLQSLWIE